MKSGANWRVVASVAGGAVAAYGVHAAPLLTINRRLRVRLLPALAGLGRADRVALTFDDGPDPASTPQFLRALDDLGWRATFFLLGEMIRRAPSLPAEIVAAGHEVAVHGDRHRSHVLRTPAAVRRDIERGFAAVGDATGAVPQWFRPPYGSLSAASLLAARRLGLRPVLWTAWGRDWRAEATPATVIDDIRVDLQPGATVLLHDSDCTSAPGSWHSALGALPRLAEELAGRRLGVGTLAEHGVA